MSAAKLIPFPARSIYRNAEIALMLTTSRELLCKPAMPWANRPPPLDTLGNMLQRLALVRPTAVLVLESIVTEMLVVLDQETDRAPKGGTT